LNTVYIMSLTVSELFSVKYWRDLEI